MFVRTLLNRISVALLLALTLAVPAFAAVPSVADLDAQSRAGGNRRDVAMAVGKALFKSEWPVQIFKVEANAVGSHVVVGLGLYGVKFHRPVDRAQFTQEVEALVERALAAAPTAEEVDVWAVVPISVGKGVIVSGDLAKPTTRTVYTVSVRRTAAADLGHVLSGPNVYWDEEWARLSFKERP